MKFVSLAPIILPGVLAEASNNAALELSNYPGGAEKWTVGLCKNFNRMPRDNYPDLTEAKADKQITAAECADACDKSDDCKQANYEADGYWGTACWFGDHVSIYSADGSGNHRKKTFNDGTPDHHSVNFCYHKFHSREAAGIEYKFEPSKTNPEDWIDGLCKRTQNIEETPTNKGLPTYFSTPSSADECAKKCEEHPDCDMAWYESEGPWHEECWLKQLNPNVNGPLSEHHRSGTKDHCWIKPWAKTTTDETTERCTNMCKYYWNIKKYRGSDDQCVEQIVDSANGECRSRCLAGESITEDACKVTQEPSASAALVAQEPRLTAVTFETGFNIVPNMCNPKQCSEWTCDHFCLCFQLFPWLESLFDEDDWGEDLCPSDNAACECSPFNDEDDDSEGTGVIFNGKKVPGMIAELERDPLTPIDPLGPIWQPEDVWMEVIKPRIICGDWVPKKEDMDSIAGLVKNLGPMTAVFEVMRNSFVSTGHLTKDVNEIMQNLAANGKVIEQYHVDSLMKCDM